jgi:hypothetical protein
MVVRFSTGTQLIEGDHHDASKEGRVAVTGLDKSSQGFHLVSSVGWLPGIKLPTRNMSGGRRAYLTWIRHRENGGEEIGLPTSISDAWSLK